MKKDTMGFESARARDEKKSEKVAPKIEPLPGGLTTKWVRCGRANCKCAKGELHGPYYYHRHQSNGKRRKSYVKKSELPVIKAGINELRRLKADARSFNERAKAEWRQLKDRLRELKKLMKEAGIDI